MYKESIVESGQRDREREKYILSMLLLTNRLNSEHEVFILVYDFFINPKNSMFPSRKQSSPDEFFPV
jgi:hypothetical protein